MGIMYSVLLYENFLEVSNNFLNSYNVSIKFSLVMALGIGLGTGVFELVARCSNAVSIAAAGVVTGATGTQFESVGELIGMGAKGNSVAVDRHRARA